MDFEQIRKDTELKEGLKSLETTLKRFAEIKPPQYPTEAIYELKRAMEGLKGAIAEIDVPKEVTIRRKIDFSDITRRFLIWYFAISFAVVAVCLWYAIRTHYKTEEEQNKAYEEGRAKGINDGYTQVLNFLNDTGQKKAQKSLKEAIEKARDSKR